MWNTVVGLSRMNTGGPVPTQESTREPEPSISPPNIPVPNPQTTKSIVVNTGRFRQGWCTTKTGTIFRRMRRATDLMEDDVAIAT